MEHLTSYVGRLNLFPPFTVFDIELNRNWIVVLITYIAKIELFSEQFDEWRVIRGSSINKIHPP